MNNIVVTATLNDLISPKLNKIISLTEKFDRAILKLGKDIGKLSNVKFDGVINGLSKVNSKLDTTISKAISAKSRLNAVNTGTPKQPGGSIGGGKSGGGGMSMGGVVAGGIAIATAGIGMLGKSIIENTSNLEQNQIAFETMLGSAEKAAKLMSDIRELEAKTPLTTSDLNKSATTLLSFGIAQEKIIDTQKMIGDVAMGNKDKFDRLTLAFAQTTGKGRLMGQEVLQMIEAGFNPLQVISEKTGESMVKLQKRMEDGKISAEEVAEAFKTVTSEGGRFFNAMENQSKTLAGVWSTLQSKVEAMAAKFGTMFLPLMKSGVDKISQLMDSIDFEVVEDKIIGFMKPIIEFGQAIAANFDIIKQYVLDWYAPMFQVWDALKNIFSIFTETTDKASAMRGVLKTISFVMKVIFLPARVILVTFTTIFDIATRIFVSIFKWIRSFETVRSIFSFVGNIVDNIKNGLMDAFKWMGGIYKKFIDFITFGSGKPAPPTEDQVVPLGATAESNAAAKSKTAKMLAALERIKKNNAKAGIAGYGDNKDKLEGTDTTLKTDRSITNVTLTIAKVVETGGIQITTENITESATEIGNIVETYLVKALADATNIKLNK